MKITEDVRKCPEEQDFGEEATLTARMAQMLKEFIEKGVEAYAKA